MKLNIKKIKNMCNKKSGFTLLFASIAVTLILSIGIAIANVTLNQLILSSAGRDSQFAFYSADTGLECALYYEYTQTSSDGTSFFPPNSGGDPAGSISCDGMTSTSPNVTSSGSSATTTFSINPASPGCSTTASSSFDIQVSRSASTNLATPNATDVHIESRGYSTCDSNNPRRVERGLFVNTTD